MSENSIIGAIEIGTAKVVVAIGEVIDGQGLNIIGVGESCSQGIIKGNVVDFEAASGVVHAAIMAAEDRAGVNLSSVFLAQTGYHLQGFFNESAVTVSGSNGHVGQDDIDRVTKDAKGKQLADDRVYIHHIQNPFMLDGRVVTNPLGMYGGKLQVGYWSVHGDLNKVRDHMHLVNTFGIKVEDVIVSGIASGSMVASQAEKVNGVLVLDIGRGVTDFIVYQGGYVVLTGVVPIGGDHLTNDISLGLRIDRNQAEAIKREYGGAVMDEGADVIMISGEGHVSRSVSRGGLSQIVNARVRELFSIIRAEVEGRILIKDLAAGVILTGGGSRLVGIDAVAREVLGMEVRFGENPEWACESLRDPEYSTVLGLLHYALRSKEKRGVLKVKKSGILNRVAKILNIG